MSCPYQLFFNMFLCVCKILSGMGLNLRSLLSFIPALVFTSLRYLLLRDIILRRGRQLCDKSTHRGTKGRGSSTEREKIKYHREG